MMDTSTPKNGFQVSIDTDSGELSVRFFENGEEKPLKQKCEQPSPFPPGETLEGADLAVWYRFNPNCFWYQGKLYCF